MSIHNRAIVNVMDALAVSNSLVEQSKCCIGFDGFIDHIYRVVKQRTDLEDCIFYERIGEFGERISASSGKSSDTEIVLMGTRFGGNGPNLAASMASLGFPTTCIGFLGETSPIYPFDSLEEICNCVSIGKPAITHAFEFNDGKLMFGCMNGDGALTWIDILMRVGLKNIATIMQDSKLIAIVNWSYLYNCSTIVRGIMDDILGKLQPDMLREKILFFDFADISMRSRVDIKEMLDTLASVSEYTHTVLGLNENEAKTLCQTLGLSSDGDLREIVVQLGSQMKVDTLTIHSIRNTVCIRNGEVVETPSFYVDAPFISTGGGDNYNGGFCLGLLLGLSTEECLILGSATASYYITNGRNCTKPELIDFLQKQLSKEIEP